MTKLLMTALFLSFPQIQYHSSANLISEAERIVGGVGGVGDVGGVGGVGGAFPLAPRGMNLDARGENVSRARD